MTPSDLLNLVQNPIVRTIWKDKPFEVKNFQFSCLKCKFRKSKINFHQNFNLVTPIRPKMSKF